MGVDGKLHTQLGFGATSCVKVVELYRARWNSAKFDYMQYINGYISAYNNLKRGEEDWADRKDTSSLLLFVVNHWKENPFDRYGYGVIVLMRQ